MTVAVALLWELFSKVACRGKMQNIIYKVKRDLVKSSLAAMQTTHTSFSAFALHLDSVKLCVKRLPGYTITYLIIIYIFTHSSHILSFWS